MDYGLAGIMQDEVCQGAIPAVALEQARRAARNGVGLETVIRRYVLGHTLLMDFVTREAERSAILGGLGDLRGVQQTQGVLLDRLIVEIADEYKREVRRTVRSCERWIAEGVRRLLAGESVDLGDADYELGGWHLGVIATGGGADRAIQVAAGLDRRFVCVESGDGTIWIWLAGQHMLTSSDIDRVLPAPSGVLLAAGEPGRGIEGFRSTHSQAQAALRVALRKPQKLTRYADVALLASASQDGVLAQWLKAAYLSPLGDGRNGVALRRTMRAYFAAECSVERAASDLGVTRHTIERHLRRITAKLGRGIQTCQAELEVALRLEEFDERRGLPG